MKSRLFFRESGHVIRTRSRWAGMAWPAAAGLALLLLLAWGHAVDNQAEADEAQAVALQAGRVLERMDTAESVAAAYLQGRRDGARVAICAAEAQP